MERHNCQVSPNMNAERGFRDCSVCLEPLYQPRQRNDDDDEDTTTVEVPTERKMTFIVPCGHVFHTDCFRSWNKARFSNLQALQCATCTGPVGASYFVMDDHRCDVCRQSLYQSQQAVILTLPDQFLVHTECWTLFQKCHSEAKKIGDPIHQWSCSRKRPSAPVSFSGQPVRQTHRVFLFHSDSNREAMTLDVGTGSLSTRVREWAARLASHSSSMDEKVAALHQALFMLLGPAANALSTLSVSFLPTVLEAMSSPTRQTAIAVMIDNAMVPSIAGALDQLERSEHQNSAAGNFHGRKAFYEHCCILVALMCANDSTPCKLALTSGAFAHLLFGGVMTPSITTTNNNAALSFGAQVARTAFVQFPTETQRSIHMISAGVVPVIFETMYHRIQDAQILRAGLEFLTLLPGIFASQVAVPPSSSSSCSVMRRRTEACYEGPDFSVCNVDLYRLILEHHRDDAALIDLAELLVSTQEKKTEDPSPPNRAAGKGSFQAMSMVLGSMVFGHGAKSHQGKNKGHKKSSS